MNVLERNYEREEQDYELGKAVVQRSEIEPETVEPYKVVVCFSGGLDSTVNAFHWLDRGYEVHLVTFDYGQRHSREIEAARRIHGKYFSDTPHQIVDLTSLKHLLKGSSQTDENVPVPYGHYAQENMKSTVVANRNMILISIAAGYGVSVGARYVAISAHSGDHDIYPDCREDFFKPLGIALEQGNLWSPIHLSAPFLHYTKGDIVTLGSTLGVPFEETWSCYEGKDIHCGLCGTCIERRESFFLAEVEDPTVYKVSRDETEKIGGVTLH